MSKQYPGGIVSKTPVVPTSLSAPGMWTLNQQAAAQATNTWPFPRDPQFKNVTMLLHGDGSAGAVPATGVGAGVSTTVTNFNADASTNNFNVTINGDARSDNLNPYQAGYYSNYFAGTSGQYLNAPANAAFSFGTGDFTVEGWVYPTSTSGTRPIVEIRTTGGATGFAFLSQSGASTLNVYTNSAFVGASTNSLTLNAWSHVALVRSGNTWTYWINGVSSGSFTNSSTQSDGATTGPKIGGSTSAGEVWVGYLSNIRIIKGTAVYTSAFTPSTTPLTAISGTSLLTCQSNRFIDTSSNAFTITVNGSPQVSPAQPFTLPSSVATYGSGYFDGSDYLSAPTSSAYQFGSGDFTIECWAYMTSAAQQFFFSQWNSPNRSWGFLVRNSGTTLSFVYSTTGSNETSIDGTIAAQAGRWAHFAAVRSGNTLTTYMNGVSVATASMSGVTLYSASQAVEIGRNPESGAWGFTGYMGDVRVVKGTAITPPVGGPTSPLTAVSGTSLLTTQYNGGGNNSGFKDSSQYNFPISRNGNTTQGTFTPYGSNWSNFTSSSSDYLSCNMGAAAAFGTGDFTVEAFVFATSALSSGDNPYICDTRGGGGVWLFSFNPSGTSNPWELAWNNSAQLQSTTSMVVNQWNHCAYVRSGTTGTLYLNGASIGTWTDSYNYSASVSSMTIARRYTLSSGTQFLPGYLSNLRIVKGTAVYTGAFTPSTTPLTAITNTVLLTCQSNRFVDNSASPLTLTVNGSPSVQGFSPFAPLTVYNPTTYGGSAYFDGTTDFLTATAPNLSGTWTVELWWYPLNVTSQQTFVSFNSGSYQGINMWCNSSGQMVVDDGFNGQTAFSTVTFKAGQWNHIAIVRNGSTTTGYINGAVAGSNSFTPSTTNAINIGRYNGGSPAYVSGYIANLRVTNLTALYVAAFTPPIAPVTATSATNFLLNATNPAILDNAMMNNLETVGNAAVSTSVKKYGAASIYLDGTGDYLLAKSNDVFNFGTGDFTVEFWINASASGSYTQTVGTLVSGTEDGTWRIGNRHNSTNTVYFARGTGSGFNEITASVNVNDGAWHHVAVTRASGTVRIFVDGTSSASSSITGTCTSSNALYVGYNGRDNAYVTGYIDELRITKGVARYTATFTVPDQAFPNG